jgi:hypothetical protein
LAPTSGSRNLVGGEPFSLSMHRLLAILVAVAALGAAASPASAATGHCRPRAGEHVLARSAEAVVYAKLTTSVQELTGCSRRTGGRRLIDALQRQSADDPTKLIGLRLAGTRVAYVTTGRRGATPITDDALHGGRRHTLLDNWPFSLAGTARMLSWTVDAEGDVAFIMRGDAPAGVTDLVVWRRGLGTRLIDSRATLTGVRLRHRTLTWRRNGVPHALDLARIPRSVCAPGHGAGTLAFDMAGFDDACLRSTGATEELSYRTNLLDANGPYIVYGWVVHIHGGVGFADLTAGTSTEVYTTLLNSDPYGNVTDAVVTDHGSIAWTAGGVLGVRDGAGTRVIPGAGTGPLLRDGSTVTWSGGGPTVTLNP